jgi:uncharacterized RDD family membrane protein YckC/predicted Ser/Thr protein kinase
VSDGAQGTPALEATILSTRLPAAGEAAAPTDALVGERIRHFVVERLLGRGGMGSVYLGTDTSLERPVALKVLSPEIAHDPEVVARFEREARAQARLRHPNVAQIYFIGEERGLHFFALEFLEGPALDEVVAQRRLPWTEALEYTIAAARGLRAALAHGFIHRDVKPSNLVLDRESGIKILDFGLVKSLNGDAELTRNGAIIGSPLYMAPEQGRGEDVDHRADIYSLGCALYHMLTGRPPFSGPSPVGVIAMHMTDRAAPVRSIAPDVPETLARVVDKMMGKTPADRYPGYDELILALEGSRPGQRELSGFKTRSVALAVDLVPLLLLGVILQTFWVAAVTPIYFVLCHRLTGQTLGKRLFRLAVTDRSGRRLSWKTSILRFLAFAWGPLAITLLVGLLFFVHRRDRVSFDIGSLTSEQLTEPLLYLGLGAVIFVSYLAGFLVAAFHPKKLALHDLLCGTEVRYKVNETTSRVGRFLKATTRFRL